jgi:hypothetical protein
MCHTDSSVVYIFYFIIAYFVSRLQSKNFPIGEGVDRRFEVFTAQAGDTSWPSRR